MQNIMKGATKLRELTISDNCDLTGDVLDAVGGLPSLRYFLSIGTKGVPQNAIFAFAQMEAKLHLQGGALQFLGG